MSRPTHSQLVTALVKKPADISMTLTDNKVDLIHATMGVVGEAGELLDGIKKHVIYNKELDVENVVEELGDLEFYLEQLRQRLGISREETLEANITKLMKRYEGLNYTDAAAHARADKEPDGRKYFRGEPITGDTADMVARVRQE
jgi:NTP pyrophosphatase (non-canonical NTP hydrolase)